MTGSPRAVTPTAAEPIVPLNPWIARASAFSEAAEAARRVVSRYDEAAGKTKIERERLQLNAQAKSLEIFAQWLDQSRDHAEAKGRAPMTMRAEHIVRKATAAVQAAARAWRAA